MVTKDYSQVANDTSIDLAVKSLIQNGIKAEVVDTLEQAKQQVLSYIPKGSEVFTSTSKTLENTGLVLEINQSGNYDSVRNKLMELQGKEGDEVDKQRRQLGATPEFILGSVHAITETGEVLIASATGSQIGPYAYSAKQVIWVVGAQKIVKDMSEAMDRLKTYTLPLEDQRLKQAHGPHVTSAIRKILIVDKEFNPERIRLILIKQNVGF